MPNKEIDNDSEDSELELDECHCSGCGRFLGYRHLICGFIRLLCPKCKVWTDFVNLS